MIDSSYSVETPEGVELRLKVAGCGIRSGAWIIDTLIHAGFLIVSSIVLGFLSLMNSEIATAVNLLLMFVLTCFYPVYFEVFRNGQTPGKKAMGIQAIHSDGTPIGLKSSLIRNFLRFADFLPTMYLSGIFSIFLDKKSRRLGDLAANTLVVFVDETKKKYELPDVKAKVVPVQLDVAEKTAIVAFAERNKLLSQPRKEELAEILFEVHGKKKEKAVREVQAYASSLVGVYESKKL